MAGGEVGKRVGEQIGRAVGKHAGGIIGALAIGSLAYSLYYKLAGDHGKEPSKRDLLLALERERAKTQMLIEQNQRSVTPQLAYGSNSTNQRLMDKLDDIQSQLDQVERIRESEFEPEFEPDFQEGFGSAAMAGGKLALGGLKKLGQGLAYAAKNPGAAIKKVGEVTKPLHSPSQVLGDKAAKSSNGIVSKVGKIFSTENQAKAGTELFDSAKMGPQLPFKRKAAAFGSKVAGAVGDMAAQQGTLAAGGAAIVGGKKMIDATRNDLNKTQSRSVIKSAANHSAVSGTALGALSGIAGGKAAALVGGTAGATLGAVKGVKRALGNQAKDAAATNPQQAQEQSQAAPGHSAGQPIPEGYKMVFGRVVKIGSGTQPARAPH